MYDGSTGFSGETFMSDVYAHIISFDFCSAVLAYDINGCGFL
jgi:hypothetical protein